MQETQIIMGMPISLTVPGSKVRRQDLDAVFAEFAAVDAQFSPFKDESEVCRFNRGEIARKRSDRAMREILALCEKTRQETGGYFDITRPDGTIDPCGMVKGWAIKNAACSLMDMGFSNFCVGGRRRHPMPWRQ